MRHEVLLEYSSAVVVGVSLVWVCNWNSQHQKIV